MGMCLCLNLFVFVSWIDKLFSRVLSMMSIPYFCKINQVLTMEHYQDFSKTLLKLYSFNHPCLGTKILNIVSTWIIGDY